MAVGCHENLCIWEPDTGDLLYKFTTTKSEDHTHQHYTGMIVYYINLIIIIAELSVTGLSYSPNGAHLAVGLASGETQVFDIESNCCIFTLETHNEVRLTISSIRTMCYVYISLCYTYSILQQHVHWHTLRMVSCWQSAIEMDRSRYGKVRIIYLN